jgi:GNAT superfamily N-acetyltransferase
MPGDRLPEPGLNLIRRARPDEAPALRELAHRSKAHWPYDRAFLAAAAALFILDPRHVADEAVFVLELDGQVAGWHRVTLHGDRAELEDLWLEPEWIGSGHGRILFEHAIGVARAAGATRLEWDAEPYAEGFYLAMEGEEIGRTPSGVEPGKTLPRMRLLLNQSRRRTSPMRPNGGRGSA